MDFDKAQYNAKLDKLSELTSAGLNQSIYDYLRNELRREFNQPDYAYNEDTARSFRIDADESDLKKAEKAAIELGIELAKVSEEPLHAKEITITDHVEEIKHDIKIIKTCVITLTVISCIGVFLILFVSCFSALG